MFDSLSMLFGVYLMAAAYIVGLRELLSGHRALLKTESGVRGCASVEADARICVSKQVNVNKWIYCRVYPL